ncbi:RNA-directed DNA polymerase, eukaryota, reverse transcriptase zinc-binding domain protein [Tanacetum coccineum]|uniref:Protein DETOXIFICATION n=1 Tax=Tanacetum coccineum TaxID=301880 RepID=A0ABQ4X9Q7_9ASTR
MIMESKLDRFLVSDSLLCNFPRISSVTLDRYLSDHRPILMRDSIYDYGPIPFKFYHYWFEIDGFDKLVEDFWNEIHVVDNNAYVRFMKKLKLLKKRIKAWNSSYREFKNCRKNTLKTELTNLDSVLDRGEGIDTDVTRRSDVVRILQDIEKTEAMEVAQKAKIKWAVEGDENSKYYHGVINKKRNNLAIRGVLVDGNWVESPQLVKNEFYTHFKQRFEKPNLSGIQFDREFPNKICSEQIVDLEREVSKEEVKRANLIECDVVNAVKWFFLHERIPSGGNSSFITLIPKVSNANMVKDFRPISLIGSVYKIVAKILANCLVLVLGDLVSDTQSAFLKERQILDGPFILNEVIQWCKKKKKQSMIFQVDFEKAYDSVRWDFVDTILKKFGFGDKWCKWIHSCLQSSKGSILINDSPMPEFQFFKGLKQGDPLSPFLFILVMESLHLSFQRVVDAGLFSGIKLDSSMSVSHLFYADDAIFMGQWNQSNIDTIVRVLKVFHSASGLRINMKKSKLMGIAVDASRVEQAIRQIGCMALKMPFKYLGSVVGDRMSRVKAWNDVIDTLVTRLSRWKLKTISIGGRLTLLKSVLGSTPIFHMSIYKVPMAVLRTMEGIRARFFNGADNKVRKSSWVSWNQVMASKDAGGLGVASLFALNRGLLFKWVWRFITQKNSLWAKVITAIHGDDGKIGKTVKPTFPSIWLNIIQEVAVMKLKGIDVVSFIKPKCGDGTNISFWNDAWRGDVAFKILAPRIYMLESMKDIQVATKLSHVDLEWSFRRKSRGGAEQIQMTTLKEILEGCILSDTKDTWTWSLEGSGEFSVSSIRKTIDAAFLPCGNVKTRWVKEVPIKINILAWKVSNDYLPTRFNLSRRGMDIGSIVCPMCNSMVESSRHLFFSCDLSNQIMSKISRWWDLGYQEINSYEEWTDWMLSIRLPYNLKKDDHGEIPSVIHGSPIGKPYPSSKSNFSYDILDLKSNTRTGHEWDELGMGSALETLCGQAFGAGQVDMLGVYMQRSWVILFVTSLIMMFLYIFATPLLLLIGQTEDISRAAGTLALWMIPQLFAYALNYPIAKFLQAQMGRVVEHGQGSAGPRLAICGVLLNFLLHQQSCFGSLETWYFMALVLFAGYLKNAEIAVDALSICTNILGWAIMVAIGFNAAISVRVSNELGAAHPRTAKFSVVVVVISSFLVGVLLAILLGIFRHQYPALFADSLEVQEAVYALTPLLAACLIINNIQPALSGVAIGAGWQAAIAYINIACYYIFGVPLGLTLGFAANWGVKGIWIGMLTGTVVQTIILIVICYRTNWDKEASIAEKRIRQWSGQKEVVGE